MNVSTIFTVCFSLALMACGPENFVTRMPSGSTRAAASDNGNKPVACFVGETTCIKGIFYECYNVTGECACKNKAATECGIVAPKVTSNGGAVDSKSVDITAIEDKLQCSANWKSTPGEKSGALWHRVAEKEAVCSFSSSN
jgi:hypothetical protein